MNAPTPRPPLSQSEVIDRYFLEHRAKVLDLAAFLDRADRAAGNGEADFRLVALRDALVLLVDDKPERARRILELWSDPTQEPVAQAGGKGAVGVWPRYDQLAPGI